MRLQNCSLTSLISYENPSEKINSCLADVMKQFLDSDYEDLMNGAASSVLGPIFVDFISEPVGDGPKPYEEITEIAKLRATLEEKLDDYNVEPGFTPMELVLFPDAMCHVARIARVLSQPRGNATTWGWRLRQAITNATSCVYCRTNCFQIKITKNYRSMEFHEDLKQLYIQSGVDNKPTVFLMPDTQMKEESFLEDINNILSSGVVPGLFLDEEKAPIIDGVRERAKKARITETADALWAYFISQVRKNLHVVLAMSPVGDAFRNRVRMYPALVNCTTTDKFFDWPKVALKEVAVNFLDEVEIDGEGIKERLASSISKCT